MLAVSVTTESSAGGHRANILLFTNRSSTACQTGGYPGLDGILAGGGVVHAQRTLNGYLGGIRSGEIQTLTLSPGQTVSATVEGLNNPNTNTPCAQFSSFLTTPPNTMTTTRLTPVGEPFSYCQNVLQVHPLVAGTTGDQNS